MRQFFVVNHSPNTETADEREAVRTAKALANLTRQPQTITLVMIGHRQRDAKGHPLPTILNSDFTIEPGSGFETVFEVPSGIADSAKVKAVASGRFGYTAHRPSVKKGSRLRNGQKRGAKGQKQK